MSPYEETKSTFEANLDSPMTPEVETLFDEIYQMTLEPALAKTKWEGEGREWVLKQVGKIARKAQAENPGKPIERNALARAANHQIPLASNACRFGPGSAQAEEVAVEGVKEDFGVFCPPVFLVAIL